MNIGINAAFHARGGSLTNFIQLLRYWKNLSNQHNVKLFTNIFTLNALKDEIPPTWSVILIRPELSTLPGRVLAEQIILPRLLAREKINVLYCPANTAPLLVHQPCVVTFQNFGPFSDRTRISVLGLATWTRFQVLKIFMWASARKAEIVLFGSQNFLDSFQKEYTLSPNKARVVYRACEPASQSHALDALIKEHKIKLPYFLCVSQLVGYKNIIELIIAYHQLWQNNKELPALVIAGGSHGSFYKSKVSRLLDRLSIPPDKLIFTGALAHAEILALIQNAFLFVFPSTCESCPTALIEALHAGVPILCSNIPPMPEIAGQAPLYFNPDSPEDIAQKLQTVMSNPETLLDLKTRASRQALQLPDPRKMAEIVWENILEAGSRPSSL